MSEEARTAFTSLSTATVTMALLKKGLRNVWLRGVRALDPSAPRVVGRAFTMRFVPGREDLATPESLSSSKSTRFAIEEIPPGSVAVVSSCGIVDAGVFGDILCARMVHRGVGGLITDGAVRDVEGVRRTGLPVWCSGVSAPPSVAQLTFVDWQQPIGCGGVAIFPDDILIADQDGAVVIPKVMAQDILESSRETEALEEWILEQVNAGRKLPGLYPPNAEAKAEFLAWRSRRQPPNVSA
jgi:regulator of RNase E activity RraA